MLGLGTMINCGGIIAGGLLGLLFGNLLQKRFQEGLMTATAVCVLFIGIGGALQEMLTISNGQLSQRRYHDDDRQLGHRRPVRGMDEY